MTDTPKTEPTTETDPFAEEDGKSAKKIAADYLIPMSDGALKEWDGKDGFAEYAASVAAGMFPTLAPQLQAGITTKALLDPYTQIAKQLIGDDTEPDWSSPLWSKALSGGTDPKTGHPTVMPLNDWITYLKSTPGTGYEYTPQAHEAANNLAQAMTSGANASDGSIEGAQ